MENTTSDWPFGNDTQNFGPPPCEDGGPPPGFENGPPPPGYLITVSEQLFTFIPPILIVFGTFGNVLTMIVIFRKFRRLNSTAMFLLVLAFSDTLFLFSAPLRQFIRHAIKVDGQGYDVRQYSVTGCKISVYLAYASSQLSSWLLVAVTIERVISVMFPHRVRTGCTTKLSVVVIVMIFVTLFGLNAHILYGFGKSTLPFYQGGAICEPLYDEYFDFFHLVWPWIDFAVAFAAPFIILITSNTIIICMLHRAHSRRRRLSVMKSQGHKTNAKDTKMITVMLVLLTVVFLVCLTPSSIYFIYLPFKKDALMPLKCTDPLEYIRQTEVMQLWFAITNCLGYINASINFLLYVLSGSKFRSEVKSLLCCEKMGADGVFYSSSRDNSTKLTNTSGRSRASTSSTRSSSNDSVSGQHGTVEGGIKMNYLAESSSNDGKEN